MKKELKEKFPNWYEDLNQYELCLTDDIDSLLSCVFLQKMFWCGIKVFYSFDTLYKKSELMNEKLSLVGVDLDLSNGRCFGNHVTYIKNPLAINLNNVNLDKRYFKKYPCSTILLILSIYDFDISVFSEEQLMVLLSIDSSYQGYYNELFRGVQVDWYDKLGFKERFIEILDKHTPEDFKEIKNKYCLYEKITVIDKKLYTKIKLKELSSLFEIDISLPKFNFELCRKYENKAMVLDKAKFIDKDNIFSSAITRKNFVNMSIRRR